jgi:hypothetical protein
MPNYIIVPFFCSKTVCNTKQFSCWIDANGNLMLKTRSFPNGKIPIGKSLTKTMLKEK